MHRIACTVAIALVALLIVQAGDNPKKENKPSTPRDQYESLVKQFTSRQAVITSEADNAEGEERDRLLKQSEELASEFAERFYQIAEDNPNDPIAKEALFWIAQNGGKSATRSKAIKKLSAVIEQLPLGEVGKQLRVLSVGDQQLFEAVFKRADENPKDPSIADLLFWIVKNDHSSAVRAKAVEKLLALIAEMPLKDLAARRFASPFSLEKDVMSAVFERVQKEKPCEDAYGLLTWVVYAGAYRPIGAKAFGLIADQYLQHPDLGGPCQRLGTSRNPDAVESLRKVAERNNNPTTRKLATLALGQTLSARIDTLGDDLPKAEKIAIEAERIFTKVIDDYGKDDRNSKQIAEKELKALHYNRVGLIAPEIAAEDLDGKIFKLSDYRGKVVLLDFWGNW